MLMLMQVPHLTTLLSSITLRDANGFILVNERVPANHQTRFVSDNDVLVNRIHIQLHQLSVSRTVNWAAVKYVNFMRTGEVNLLNIGDPTTIFWRVRNMNARVGCKGEPARARTVGCRVDRTVCPAQSAARIRSDSWPRRQQSPCCRCRPPR